MDPTVGAAGRLLRTVRARSAPNRVLTVVRETALAARAALFPLLTGKAAIAGRSTAYVCTRGVCELPTSDPAVLDRQLTEVVPLPSE